MRSSNSFSARSRKRSRVEAAGLGTDSHVSRGAGLAQILREIVLNQRHRWVVMSHRMLMSQNCGKRKGG
jgi:hypothetical protein